MPCSDVDSQVWVRSPANFTIVAHVPCVTYKVYTDINFNPMGYGPLAKVG